MVAKRIIKLKSVMMREHVVADNKRKAKQLYDQSRFGELVRGDYRYSLVEALYLIEKKKINVYDKEKARLTFKQFVGKARRVEPNFWVRYCVFRDMRNRGYIIKTALKFGADFRVYDRGIKPGEDHAKWIVFAVHEGETQSWYSFSAKNRVAHSTKKKLLIACVDDESDVTYWEISWVRP